MLSSNNVVCKNASVDPEWIKLLIEAKNIGLQPEEIRKFISSAAKKVTI